jgi:hypothetical protein
MTDPFPHLERSRRVVAARLRAGVRTDSQITEDALEIYMLWSNDPRLNRDLPGLEETLKEHGPLPRTLVESFADVSLRGRADPMMRQNDTIEALWLFAEIAARFAEDQAEALGAVLADEAEKFLKDELT